MGNVLRATLLFTAGACTGASSQGPTELVDASNDTALDSPTDPTADDTTSAESPIPVDAGALDAQPGAPETSRDALGIVPEGPSCAGGLLCGASSCCQSLPVPSGQFGMGRASRGPENDVCSGWGSKGCAWPEQPEHDATISTFALDRYEVTVGRFRKFVEAYPSSRPKVGEGSHPTLAGSGWNPSWDANLPQTQEALRAALRCGQAPTTAVLDLSQATWNDSSSDADSRAINCVNWYEAFAFCAWDGGRLPTEAEWEYAAAGGSDNRVVPWGSSVPDESRAVFATTRVESVGSVPRGAARWGHEDMAGNLWEWTLDTYGTYSGAKCMDCAALDAGPNRVMRGGVYNGEMGNLRSVTRGTVLPTPHYYILGLRCARPVTP